MKITEDVNRLDINQTKGVMPCREQRQDPVTTIVLMSISSPAPNRGRWEFWKTVDFSEEHIKELYRKINCMLRG